MTLLKRLRVLPAVLGAAAALIAIGTSLFGDVRTGQTPKADPARPDGNRLVEELAVNKFSKLPTLTYQLRDGEVLFAWQIKPEVAPTPARPRDVIVLVDTSASQAGRPIQQARQIITALTSTLTANDRVSIWTLSTPAATRPLTKDFVPADAEELRQAAADLTDIEYGSGATDLKNGLIKAPATLAPHRGRQQHILHLGDCDSAFTNTSAGCAPWTVSLLNVPATTRPITSVGVELMPSDSARAASTRTSRSCAGSSRHAATCAGSRCRSAANSA